MIGAPDGIVVVILVAFYISAIVAIAFALLGLICAFFKLKRIARISFAIPLIIAAAWVGIYMWFKLGLV